MINIHGRNIGWPKLKEVPEPEDFPLKVLKVGKFAVPAPGLLDPASFAARIPRWREQCQNFMKKKMTWAPLRPCCLPNYYLGDRRCAPDRSTLQPCFDKLSKRQRRILRNYMEGRGTMYYPRRPLFSDEPRIRYWRGLHYPELPVPTMPAGFGGGHKGPRRPFKRTWLGEGSRWRLQNTL